jgi:hypothetical protein
MSRPSPLFQFPNPSRPSPPLTLANKSRTSKQKRFLSALGSKKTATSPKPSTSPITSSSMDTLMMPPPIPKSPSKGVLNDGAMPNSSPGLGPSAASPATPAGVTNLDGLDVIEMDGLGESLFQYNPGGEVGGGDFAGLDMDNYHAYAGGEEVYNGFEMGMVGEDFAPVGIGIPGLPHDQQQVIVPTRTRPKKKTSATKGESKARNKKGKAPKIILMHEDGTTPNWEERMKKSMKPRRERKPPVGGKWSDEEDAKLKLIVETHGAKNWKGIAELLGTLRNDVQCLHRWNKVLKPGLHKGPWTEEEDNIVRYMVMEHGVGMVKWSVIANQLQGRIGKQCRERWFNHLDPAIKKGEWTGVEDNVVFEAQLVFGNRWSEIAKVSWLGRRRPNRSEGRGKG